MTAKDAEKLGMEPLAGPYEPDEYWMLEAACKQLGKIPHLILAEVERFPELLTIFRFPQTSKQEGAQ